MQVILAEDTLRPGSHLVAIKIMKRQYSYAGQKVCCHTGLITCYSGPVINLQGILSRKSMASIRQ